MENNQKFYAYGVLQRMTHDVIVIRAGLRSCGAQLVGCLRGPSILFIIVHKEEKNCKCKVAILNLSNIFLYILQKFSIS